jgi:hypothetical protein
MICPKCGNKPLSFASFLATLNPIRIRCVNCGAALRAGPIAYAWAALHLLIGVGLVRLYLRLVGAGVIGSVGGRVMYAIGVFGLLFVTAYVIPWMFLPRMYRSAE